MAGSVLGRFESVNRARLHRIREALGPEQVRFFDVMPLLFHHNRPGLPGYTSRETPAGISRFIPDRQSLDAARHLFPSTMGADPGPEAGEIQGIYCLGSLGSIAHCPRSDLDIWICHEPGIEIRRLAELNAKARVVEQWAQCLGLEVHFFLIDPERFRAGEHARLSAECSGNAQHYLLLDEFYRSSVVLAGLYPLWWMVPPGEEQSYGDCAARLLAAEPALPCVDLGGLGEIPREEFSGAALWQLSKVIDSPYKSVLKLMLLEAYADDHPRPDLLAMRYKACVYGGALDPEDLDPYLLLYRRVEEFLVKRGDAARLSLARRCLFLKIQEAQGHLPSHAARAWRGHSLAGLCRRWGWSEHDIACLATRDRWRFERVREEWREIVGCLRASCRTLTDRARPPAGSSSITAEEVKVLGRRLHTAFERRPGKFSVLRPASEGEHAEAELHLRHHPAERGSWSLSRGPADLLRIGAAPGELIAWAVLNGLAARHTRWNVDDTTTGLSTAAVETMRSFIERGLARGTATKPEANDLIAAPSLASAAVLVSVERSFERSPPERDPILWPQYRITMAELLLTTTWGERLCLPYKGEWALARCLCEYLAWPSGLGEHVPIEAMVYGAGAEDAVDLARQVERLLAQTAHVLRDKCGPHDCRGVLAWGSGFCVVKAHGGTWRAEPVGSYAALLRYLRHPLPRFTRTLLPRGTASCGTLPLVLAENRAGIVQAFLVTERDRPRVLVLDEHGALFHETLDLNAGEVSLRRYRRFLEAALARGSAAHGSRPSVHCYVLEPGERGGLKQVPAHPEGGQAPYTLRACGTPGPDAGRVFTLSCCGREFSEAERGVSAYREAALHLLDAHGACVAYSAEVSDVELSAEHSGASVAVSIIPLLQYKATIEGRLNEALIGLRTAR